MDETVVENVANVKDLIRANVSNSQTYRNNSSKIDFAHIFNFNTPWYETNISILCLAEHRHIFEKIKNKQMSGGDCYGKLFIG